MPVDLLAIAAHRDDVELTCAGTLLRAVDLGQKTGILDLTQGETGTRGSADLRAEEAQKAAAILGVTERRNAGLPDAHLQNTDEARRVVVEQIRHFKPRVVILPYPVGRHPDHRIASELARDACFLSGLQKYDAGGEVHRPHKVLYALAYREDPVKPTDKERERLRKQALGWLTAELAGFTKDVRDPGRAAEVRKVLRFWQTDRDLAAVRDAADLQKLPDAERADWRRLWAEHAELLASFEKSIAAPPPGVTPAGPESGK